MGKKLPRSRADRVYTLGISRDMSVMFQLIHDPRPSALVAVPSHRATVGKSRNVFAIRGIVWGAISHVVNLIHLSSSPRKSRGGIPNLSGPRHSQANTGKSPTAADTSVLIDIDYPGARKSLARKWKK